jgi:hypothetical protein
MERDQEHGRGRAGSEGEAGMSKWDLVLVSSIITLLLLYVAWTIVTGRV